MVLDSRPSRSSCRPRTPTSGGSSTRWPSGRTSSRGRAAASRTAGSGSTRTRRGAAGGERRIAADAPAAAARAAPRTGRLVVMYDRDCGLCKATARRLRRWDRHGRLETAVAPGRRGLGPARRRANRAPAPGPRRAARPRRGQRAGRCRRRRRPGDRRGAAGRMADPAAPRIAAVRWIVGAAYGFVAKEPSRDRPSPGARGTRLRHAAVTDGAGAAGRVAARPVPRWRMR